MKLNIRLKTFIVSISLGILFLALSGRILVNRALAQAPAQCLIYAIQDWGEVDSEIITVNSSTRTASSLHPVYPGYNLESLAIDPSTNIIYAMSATGTGGNGLAGWLFKVDGQTGDITPVADTTYGRTTALTFKATDGSLWGWHKRDGLISINKTTGASTLIFAYNSYDQDLGTCAYLGCNEVEGIAWDNAGTTLYVVRENNELWKYDSVANTFTLLRSNVFPYDMDELGDLVMRPDGKLMFAIDNEGTPGTEAIATYDIAANSFVQVELTGSIYDDLEGLAWAPSCGNPDPIPSPGTLTLTATPLCSKVRLDWVPPNGVTEYHIYRCSSSPGCTPNSQINTDTVSPFTNSSLTNGTAYRYQVRAHDHVTNAFTNSNIAAATPACASPTPTPAPSPVFACNSACTLNSQCSPLGLICDIGASNTCRNPICTTQPSCICPAVSPTPSPLPSGNGTIQARAVEVDSNSICSTATELGPVNLPVTATFNGPLASPFIMTLNPGINESQSAASGNYTLIQAVTNPPNAGYIHRMTCSVTPGNTLPNGADVSGTGQNVPAGGTVGFVLGFSTADTWFQVQRGSAHTNNSLSVDLPASKYFIEADTSLNPGIASYVTGSPSFGSGSVSSKGYLVGDAQHKIPSGYSYYIDYYRRFGAKTTLSASTLPNGTGTLTNPDVYETTGDLTITSPWVLSSGRSIVVFVNGTLYVDLGPSDAGAQNKISVPQDAFLTFIVKGNSVNGGVVIRGTTGYQTPTQTISDVVTEPTITGIFISDEAFITQPDTVARDPQLIAAGTYVAKKFTLQRDLDQLNSSYPGELFIYRPDLWRNAPETLKVTDIKWQEVAP